MPTQSRGHGTPSESTWFQKVPAMRRVWIGLFLAALVGVIYGRSIGWDFVAFDDPRYVYKNAHVLAGLSFAGVRWAFATLYDGGCIPLAWISLMADTSLYGGDFAGGYRLTNLLLHALNALLVYCLFAAATGARSPGAMPTALRGHVNPLDAPRHAHAEPWAWHPERSVFVAALFAAHPIHVESVVWVAERKDVLSVCLGLLALNAYVQFAKADRSEPGRSRGARWGWLAGCWCLLALSLLAKQTLVTFPFLLLLLDYWPLGRFNTGPFDTGRFASQSPRRLVLEKVPFLALSLVLSAAAWRAQASLGATNLLRGLTLGERLANAIAAYGQYLVNLVWPTHLAVFYPYPYDRWSSLPVVGSALVLVAVSVVCAVNLRQRPFLFVGWCWFLGTLVPVIGLVQIGRQHMADRYAYFPAIGLYVLVAWSLPRRLLELAGPPLVVACAALAFVQVGYWRNNDTLFEHALEVAADNATTRELYGHSLIEEGRTDEGLSQLRKAVELAPDDHFAHARLATGLAAARRVDEAISEFERAIALRDDQPSAYCQLAALYASQGRNDAAKKCFDKAVRLMPELEAIARQPAARSTKSE